LTVKDITVQDRNKAGRVTSLLSPAEYNDLVRMPRDITVYPGDLTLLQRSNPRPSLELHLISKAVRGTNAKESRIKVSLHSFTYNLFTDFDFATDLGTFFKAPPGVSSRGVCTCRYCDSSHPRLVDLRNRSPCREDEIVCSHY